MSYAKLQVARILVGLVQLQVAFIVLLRACDRARRCRRAPLASRPRSRLWGPLADLCRGRGTLKWDAPKLTASPHARYGAAERLRRGSRLAGRKDPDPVTSRLA